MNNFLKKLVIIGLAIFIGGFLGGCYTQLQKYSATEESYSASKSDQGTYQNSGQSYSAQEENPTETDTVYVQDNQQTENNNQQPGTTNIYNYYSPTYPYGYPYWPNSWYGDMWFDYPYYPYYDGFYFSVAFGSPYYYDPFLWDWRYSTPYYFWSTRPWYNPYRYDYWYDWNGGVDWWWYSTYTYEQRVLKHRPFDRREGLDNGRRGGLINSPVMAGGSVGSGSAAGFSKPIHRPNDRRNGMESMPTRIRKQEQTSAQYPTDAIRVEKTKRSGQTEVTRIRKAKRYDNHGDRILVRHPKRTRKTVIQAENGTRKIYIRRSQARQPKRSTVSRSKIIRRPSYNNRVRVVRRSNPSHSSTRMRVYRRPVRHSEPVIRHRSSSSSRPSYSPPAPRSRPAAPARRSSSSSRSRSNRERK